MSVVNAARTSPEAWDEIVVQVLRENQVKPITYVPDKVDASLLKLLHADDYFTVITPASEEETAGIVNGAYMGGPIQNNPATFPRGIRHGGIVKKCIGAAAAFCVFFSAAPVVMAQADVFPSKPVRLIVPFAPGGSVDVVARLVGPKLAEVLGQAVIIENRSGASGIIGTEVVARSKPDGYTLLIHTIPFVTNAHLYSRVPYDALTDFIPISLMSSSPSAMVVNSSVPARTVSELLQLAKSRPGALNYGAAGPAPTPISPASYSTCWAT